MSSDTNSIESVHPLSRVPAQFRREFGAAGVLVRSPGRVNLIGEHTDYNGGFVLPGAVDRAIYFSVGARDDGVCELAAADVGERVRVPLASVTTSDKGWANYLLGVVDEMQKAGNSVPGFNCVFGGDVPIGAGLSSSAAIEAGLAFALNELFAFGMQPWELVKLAQRAENRFVGVQCGIMDQFANIFGRPDAVLRLDCRSLEFAAIPFSDRNLRIVLCDTGVRRALASSEYNIRRKQCQQGVEALQKQVGDIESLRDVSVALLEEYRTALDPVTWRRCVYVARENERVLAGCDDLARSDFTSFGRKLFASHEGLRDDYEVSCTELDRLVEIAAGVSGVLGARMMGAGFGGCTINLVKSEAVDALREAVERGYPPAREQRSFFHVIRIEGGTSRLESTDADQ